MTRTVLGTLTAAAVALLVAVSATPASAGGWGNGSAPPPNVNTGSVVKPGRTCDQYASQSSFGLSCNSVTGGAESIRSILAGQPLPHCWHGPVPEAAKAQKDADAADRHARGEKGDWYLQTCLVGIDPVTLLETGDIRFIESYVWLEDPADAVTLLDRQALLVRIERKDRTYPNPTLLITPTGTPRVGQDVVFSLALDTIVGPITFARGGQVVSMRAKVVHLSVVPAPGLARVDCDTVDQPFVAGDTPITAPQKCWWKFDRSSADQAKNQYPMVVTAYWEVQELQGTDWNRMATFEKFTTTQQRVTEVQTLVIP